MGTTRRELMVASVLGSAWVLAGCGGSPGPRPVPRGAAADVDALRRLLGLERRIAQAYDELAPLLPASAGAFRAHEDEHVLSLEQAMRDLGASPPAPAAPVSLPRLRSPRDAAQFVVGLENTAMAAYLGSLPRVSSGDLRATLAAALTVDAEHTAVLTRSLGLDPAPAAMLGASA